MKNLTTVGERLKYLRYMLGLCRRELYEKTGLIAATFRTWEDNKTIPSSLKLQYITKLFCDLGIEVTIDWIKYGEGVIPIFKNVDANLISLNKEYSSFLSNHMNSFLAYINFKEKLLYSSARFESLINIENIENKNLRKIFGMKYLKIKPYIGKVLAGEEVAFEYHLYHKNNSTIKRLNFVPSF